MSATSTATGPQLLAHVGPLGHHDLWVIIPMAVLSVAVMIVMARPRRPPPGDDEPADAGGPAPQEAASGDSPPDARKRDAG